MEQKNKKVKIIIPICILICLTIFFILRFNKTDSNKYQTILYSEFVELAENKAIDTIYYNDTSEYMYFTLLNEDTTKMSIEERKYYKYKNSDYRQVLYPKYDEFRKDILNYNINLVNKTPKAKNFSLMNDIIIPFLPFIIFFVVLGALSKHGNDTPMEIVEKSPYNFDDVIGQDEILEDIKFITEMIKNPMKGFKMGVKVPKGILFSGPPGTGKTLIAKAIAGQAGVPFIYMNASQFIEMFAGVGAKRVRGLFAEARKNTPCIVFIDEIDAVGGSREKTRESNSEGAQTLNALLQEMDGFTGREGVFVIAATNRPDKLDKALVRAGRFDRQIEVNPPKNSEVRKLLFEKYLSKMLCDDTIDLEKLSKQTSGFTGADIEAICNEAGIIAMMKNNEYVNNDCLEEAIDKKIFKGNRSSVNKHKPDKEIVAYHEAGHAVMTWLKNKPISRASIINSTSGVGGFVMQEDNESVFMTNEELEDQILIAYAGRASEEIKFLTVTTGASSDITQATDIMLSYIEKYGFDKDFGLLDISVLNNNALIKDSSITEKISEMSRKMYKICFSLLETNYDKVEIIAKALIEKETLSGDEIKELLA